MRKKCVGVHVYASRNVCWGGRGMEGARFGRSGFLEEVGRELGL